MFDFLFRKTRLKNAAYELFAEIVSQSRNPVFYRDYLVEDTVDGRFDLISLHLALVLARLKKQDDDEKLNLVGRYLQEVMFENMDMSLREMGVGDMGVGKKVKVMAEAFYGRKVAYQQALDDQEQGSEALSGAVLRNIYREKHPDGVLLEGLTDYIIKQYAHLETISPTDIMSGKISFLEPTVPTEGS